MAGPKTVRDTDLVTIPRAEYERLLVMAGEMPTLPEPDAKGNYPARAAIAVLLARDLIRHRLALGLSQRELARRAGVRPETINRLEQGKHAPNVATVDKIERALLQVEAEVGSPRAQRRQKSKGSKGDQS